MAKHGKTASAWARKYGFNPVTVRSVINGRVGETGKGAVTSSIIKQLEVDTGMKLMNV